MSTLCAGLLLAKPCTRVPSLQNHASSGLPPNIVRATVHHVRPATYAHTNLDLHTRIVARVQHVAQRHCHLLSYLSHHRNQSPHPSSSAIIRNHRHPVPHRRFRRCTPRPALHTQRASNAHAQAAPLSASAAATAQRRTRSQSHDHHHHVPQAALRPKRK